MARDILGRELAIDDYVIFTNRIYQVTDIKIRTATILLMNKSPSTKPVQKITSEMCLLNKDDVLLYLLSRKT